MGKKVLSSERFRKQLLPWSNMTYDSYSQTYFTLAVQKLYATSNLGFLDSKSREITISV